IPILHPSLPSSRLPFSPSTDDEATTTLPNPPPPPLPPCPIEGPHGLPRRLRRTLTPPPLPPSNSPFHTNPLCCSVRKNASQQPSPQSLRPAGLKSRTGRVSVPTTRDPGRPT